MTPYIIALAALALLLARTRKNRSLTTKPKKHGFSCATQPKKNKHRKKED